MTRRLLTLALLGSLFGSLWAQKGKKQPDPQEPPEEDATLTPPKEYSFNPIQAQKEVTIGNFYFKKKSWRAAAMRFEEATKWNPGYAEAHFRLAEARERLGLRDQARESYEKFLENAADDKRAPDVKKRIAALGPPQAARGKR